MGWTSYHATHYNTKGQVDRIAECKEICTSKNEKATWTPLKIIQIGSVIYVAEERVSCDGERDVYALIFLTSTNARDYFNFSYKDMSDSCGPCEANCPTSILKLLTPTDNEIANNWRNRCYENAIKVAEKKRDKNSLNNLPIGSVIEMKHRDGNIRKLRKMEYYRPKTIWTDGRYRYSNKTIERQGYTVISVATT